MKISYEEFNDLQEQQIIRTFINDYLGTDFDENDMDIIYTYLGNGLNHYLTTTFISTGFNMEVLERGVENE